ncbi:hypothetical protein [Clostridium botulinum]|uniref:hypothetical protein n=1 Tax=Clostridium botulinum TaxID=1491 RepID=UPI001E42B9BA|nr:hypothetical protein [Clostridium botulinum]MCC5440504.1 hypothetical protein [Clostridium botulinum]NFR59762.1 hypothetical protein [Clostridium botulinum]
MKRDEKSEEINNKTDNDRMYEKKPDWDLDKNYEKKPDWDLDKNYEKRQQMILDSVRAVK